MHISQLADPTMTVDEYRLVEAMQTYGGSFAKAIAEAWYRADGTNRYILRTSFGDLLESYRPFLKLNKFDIRS
jgi:hypothetical protein